MADNATGRDQAYFQSVGKKLRNYAFKKKKELERNYS